MLKSRKRKRDSGMEKKKESLWTLTEPQREFCECDDRLAFWSNEEVVREVKVKLPKTVYLGADEGYNGCCYFTEIPETVKQIRRLHARHGLTHACIHLCVKAVENGETVQMFGHSKRLSVMSLRAVAARLDPERMLMMSDETVRYDSGGRVDCYPLGAKKALRGIGCSGDFPPEWIILDAGSYDVLERDSPIHWFLAIEKAFDSYKRSIVAFEKTKVRVAGLNLPEALTKHGRLFLTYEHTPLRELPPWIDETQCEKLEALMRDEYEAFIRETKSE